MLTIAVLKDTAPGEKRVALVPESVKRLSKLGAKILLENGIGEEAGFTALQYEEAGGSFADLKKLLKEGNVFLKAQMDYLSNDNNLKDADSLPEKAVVVGFMSPFKHLSNVQKLADKGLTSLSMELVPRISRAQRMDALSAMSSAAGYKAVVLAAASLNKFFPLMMTAAGTISPAKVIVIGAGVAGLQAIATAKRLGANVFAFDTRPVVKEQVESLGANFVALEHAEDAETDGGYATEQSADFYKHEQEIIAEHLKDTDVVVTTAQIFGKPAPLLITEEMVKSMRSGSVIVDLAAEAGGNCSYTETGKTVIKHGISIHGETDYPSTLSYHSSEMYSRNVTALLQEMIKDGELVIDLDDEVINGTLLTHEGKIINQHVLDMLERNKEE